MEKKVPSDIQNVSDKNNKSIKSGICKTSIENMHDNAEKDIWKHIIASENSMKIQETWDEISRENPEKLVSYFLLLPIEKQVTILSDLTTVEQENVIAQLANRGMHIILEYMRPDDLVELFRNISREVRDAVWYKLSDQTRMVVQFLLRFDHDDAAGIMTPRYVAIQPDSTVKATIDFIRANIDNVETIYYIYVIDAVGRLQGVVSLRDLIKNKDSVKIQDCMVHMVYSAQEETDRKEVAALLEEYSLLAVPVVDSFNRLRGIVTVDDVIDVIHTEHDEDVFHMNALAIQPKNMTYLDSSVRHQFRTRIPWLILLLMAGTLTSNVISVFSNTLTIAGYLIWFIPVVTSTGGNTATQSSILIIRGLARNELEFRDIFAILIKEILVALLIGICLGSMMIVRGMVFPPHVLFIEATTISLALLFVVLFSSIIGVLVPLVLSRFNIDPTVIATPFIATIIDLLGLTVYFSIAHIILMPG